MIQRLNLFLVWLVALGVAVVFLRTGIEGNLVGQDAHAYWKAVQGGLLYDAGPAELDAYLYSPAFALAIWPLGLLPWAVFYVVWTMLEAAALWWLVRPLPVRWAVPAALVCVPELMIGNIYLLLAAMVAIGVRHPSAWAFGALTKITPGVGVLWHFARRDWRGVGAAALVTAGITLTSVAITPGAWPDWFKLLLDNTDGDPTLVPRCILGLGLAVWAARPGRTWMLALAIVAVTPVFNAFACLAPLVAIPRLRAVDAASGQDGSSAGDTALPRSAKTQIPARG